MCGICWITPLSVVVLNVALFSRLKPRLSYSLVGVASACPNAFCTSSRLEPLDREVVASVTWQCALKTRACCQVTPQHISLRCDQLYRHSSIGAHPSQFFVWSLGRGDVPLLSCPNLARYCSMRWTVCELSDRLCSSSPLRMKRNKQYPMFW